MKKITWSLLFALISICFLSNCRNDQIKTTEEDYSGWKTYAGTKSGSRYSSNEQINTENVNQLQVAWIYSSNDKDTGNRSQNQCNPIIVDGILYATSPRLKLLALDASTGKAKWVFDPSGEDTASYEKNLTWFKVSRGVVYWQDENGTDKRIFYSVGSKTYCIN